MRSLTLMDVCLDLFDGGAAGAAPAGGDAAGETSTADNSAAVSQQSKKAGAFDNVVFGKQAEADSSDAGSEKPEQAAGSDNTVNRQADFDKLIEDYKDEFTDYFQQRFNRRFAETKGLQEQLDAQSPVIQTLMAKYNVDDVEKLSEAIDKDDAMWESAAEAEGLTVEAYKNMQKLKAKTAQYEQEEIRRKGEEAVQAQMQTWAQQSEAVKVNYPEFNLTTELKDPNFLKILRSGVDMQKAYEVIHMDDIKSTVAQSTAKTTEKNVTDNIRAKGARVAENGASAAAGVITKDSASKLTKAERAEIARRVGRGEQIVF